MSTAKPQRIGASPFEDPNAGAPPPPPDTDMETELPPEVEAVTVKRRPLDPVALAALQAKELAEAEAEAAAAESEDLYEGIDLEELRRKRKPFGQISKRLDAPQRRGFFRHWFVDKGERIQAALDAAYSIVKNAEGKPTKVLCGKHDNGDPMFQYLMEIPLPLYLEDKKAKQESLNEKDRQIYSGRLKVADEGGEAINDETNYIPRSTPMNARVERGMGR